MSCDHVQADNDLNEHLRGGARAELTEMKYIAGGSGKNRPAFFQNPGIASHHIAKLPVLSALLTAADRCVDHLDSLGAAPYGDFSHRRQEGSCCERRRSNPNARHESILAPRRRLVLSGHRRRRRSRRYRYVPRLPGPSRRLLRQVMRALGTVPRADRKPSGQSPLWRCSRPWVCPFCRDR